MPEDEVHVADVSDEVDADEGVYEVPMTTSQQYFISRVIEPSEQPERVVSFLEREKPEKMDVSNKEIEKTLKGLMLAFEKSCTANYGVKRAKTNLTVTKTGEGKAELSLGLGIIKLFDAQGKVTGEIKQGIEIEIERREHRQ
jgi:hypothetical protein